MKKERNKKNNKNKTNKISKRDKACFAAGCFWGVEESFRTVKGVEETLVGYTGGHLENPRYEDIHNGKTEIVLQIGQLQQRIGHVKPNDINLSSTWEYLAVSAAGLD